MQHNSTDIELAENHLKYFSISPFSMVFVTNTPGAHKGKENFLYKSSYYTHYLERSWAYLSKNSNQFCIRYANL